MHKYINYFYKKLYKRDQAIEENITSTKECLSSILHLVTNKQNEALTLDIYPFDLKKVDEELPKGKAPRKYGISIEFFQILYEDIERDLLEFIKEVLNLGQFIEFFNTSKICLILITCDLTQVTNYRPISLLGSIYKFLAKFIAIELYIAYPYGLKNPNTFVKERSIFDNIYMAFELMDLIVTSGQNLVMLPLNFEKHMTKLIESS